MKFVIMGASGFVGSHVFRYLKKEGYDTIGTQSRSKYPDLCNYELSKDRIKDCIPKKFLDGDNQVFGVICIKYGLMDRYAIDRNLSRELEIEKTKLLIIDLLELGIKPVYLTTSYVFDGSAGYYPDDFPHSPVSEYGRQKAEIEKYIKNSSKDILALRLDKIVGNNPSDAQLFSEWYQWLLENRSITCIEGQILSPTFAGDIAKGIYLGCKNGLSGIYNIANPEFFLRDELARQFALALGRAAQIISKPQSEFNFVEPRPLKSYLDSSKFIKTTGMYFTSMREVFNTFKKWLT